MVLEESVDQQELFEHHRFKADPGQSLLRIDKFLCDRIDNSSRTRIQNAANAGNILVNNKPVKPNYKVNPGDIVLVVLPAPCNPAMRITAGGTVERFRSTFSPPIMVTSS